MCSFLLNIMDTSGMTSIFIILLADKSTSFLHDYNYYYSSSITDRDNDNKTLFGSKKCIWVTHAYMELSCHEYYWIGWLYHMGPALLVELEWVYTLVDMHCKEVSCISCIQIYHHCQYIGCCLTPLIVWDVDWVMFDNCTVGIWNVDGLLFDICSYLCHTIN